MAPESYDTLAYDLPEFVGNLAPHLDLTRNWNFGFLDLFWKARTHKHSRRLRRAGSH